MVIESGRFLRQLDICPPDKLAFAITVIGAGAVGSFTVLALAKMGCSMITVWDDDLLEEHNVSNQACRPSLVGYPKVAALCELVDELCDLQIAVDCRRYKGQALKGVVITAVDSMDARQDVWQRVKLSPAVPLLIDPRMGAEFARLYSIRPSNVEDIDFYESNLYASKEAEQLTCSARSIIYSPMILAGLVALSVKSYAVGKTLAREILFDMPTLAMSVTR